DGIRDDLVTGVQTCALPILGIVKGHPNPMAMDFLDFLYRDEIQSNISRFYFRAVLPGFPDPAGSIPLPVSGEVVLNYDWSRWRKIGRASCREGGVRAEGGRR